MLIRVSPDQSHGFRDLVLDGVVIDYRNLWNFIAVVVVVARDPSLHRNDDPQRNNPNPNPYKFPEHYFPPSLEVRLFS